MTHPAGQRPRRLCEGSNVEGTSRGNRGFETIDQNRHAQNRDALLERLLRDVAALEAERRGDAALALAEPGLPACAQPPGRHDEIRPQERHFPAELVCSSGGVVKDAADSRSFDLVNPFAMAQELRHDDVPLADDDLPKGWWLLPAVILGALIWAILVIVCVLWMF